MIERLSYERWPRRNWRRLTRRLAVGSLAVAVALVAGLAALLLFLRSGTSAQATMSGAVTVHWRTAPLAGWVFDGVRVVRTSADGSTFSVDVPAGSTTNAFPGRWTDRFPEAGMRYVY